MESFQPVEYDSQEENHDEETPNTEEKGARKRADRRWIFEYTFQDQNAANKWIKSGVNWSTTH